MFDYIVGYNTDVGIRKKVNQDSLCIKKALIGEKKVLMAVICDGMGGLSKGELASATVVRAFSDWFQEELPHVYQNVDRIREQWGRLIRQCNDKLWNYGRQNGVQLGTTLTVLLLLDKEKYLIAHVGDSRAYEVGGQILQITEDQSYVAREIKRGNMTKEQALVDAKRNVLLQCIGASSVVEPVYYEGEIKANAGFLLCSDGFRHKVEEYEILQSLLGLNRIDKTSINITLKNLVEVNKNRGEADNITAIYVKQVVS